MEEKLITVSEAEKMRAELEAKLNEEIRFLKVPPPLLNPALETLNLKCRCWRYAVGFENPLSQGPDSDPLIFFFRYRS